MQYGLTFPNCGIWANPAQFGELAALAEQSGWDGIFLEDYIVWQSNQDVPTYDPWIILAVITLNTRRIRLGTTVTPLARRRPWKVARETVTLDQLSNGRLILGVGLGDTGESILPDISFTHFAEETRVARRAGMLDEALQVLTGLWSGEPFQFSGRYYHVDEVTFHPTPVQQPRIPIWVGGGFPLSGPTQRAARWDGACLYRQDEQSMTAEDIRELKAIVARQRGTLSGYDIVTGGNARRSDWEAEREHIRSLAEAGATWWTEYLPADLGDINVIRQVIQRGPLHV